MKHRFVVILLAFMMPGAILNAQTCKTVTINEVTPTSMVIFGETSTEGTTLQLGASVMPASALDHTLTWTSSNTDVATVDANGKVTKVSNGTATITATSQADPSVSASQEVEFYQIINYSYASATIPEYVNMGGKNWVTHNLGATNPEDFGQYHAYLKVNSAAPYTSTRYSGFEGGDVAIANSSNRWRTPTKAEFDAIFSGNSAIYDRDDYNSGVAITWRWCNGSTVRYNGTTVKGFVAIVTTSFNPEGCATDNMLFFPAAGSICDEPGTVQNPNPNGNYWTKTDEWSPRRYYALTFVYAESVSGIVSQVEVAGLPIGYAGFSIRPVQN